MGGFLGGLGRLVAGVGPEATEMRENMLNRWQRQKELYTNTLSQLSASESNPDTRSAYIQNLFDLNKLKPGQDPSKVIKSMQESIAIHPVAQQLLTPPQSQPKPVAPGPVVGATPGTAGTQAGPIVGGEAAGLPALAGLIAGPQPNADNGGGSSGGSGVPPAATPPTSPVAPSDQGSVAKPVGLPAGAGIAPVAAAEAMAPSAGIPPVSPTATPSVSAAGPSGAPTLQDPQDILKKYMSNPGWSAPTNRPILTAAMNRELEHNEALRQQYEQHNFELQTKQGALDRLKKGGQFEKLTPYQQSQYELWASTVGSNLPTIPASVFRPQTSRVEAETMSPEQKQMHGIPADAKGPYWTYTDIMTGQPARAAEPAGVSSTAMANDQGGITFVPHVPGAAPAGVIGSTSMLAPADTGVNASGHKQYESKFRLIPPIGGGPVSGAGINPGFIPSVSTQSTPGSLPTTTTRRKGTGGGAPTSSAGGIPPVASGGGGAAPASSSAPTASPAASPAVQQYADDILAGRSTLESVPAKERNAVQAYLHANNLQRPEQLSARGQADLSKIDPVITEIDGLLKRLDAEKLSNDNSHMTLLPDYMRYKYLHQSTPHDALFTDLSFEALRSAATALQGTNSRALPIISRALAHTPNLDAVGGAAADTPKLIHDKLNTMRQILSAGRNEILADERKSGVIKPVEGSQPARDDNGALGDTFNGEKIKSVKKVQ